MSRVAQFYLEVRHSLIQSKTTRKRNEHIARERGAHIHSKNIRADNKNNVLHALIDSCYRLYSLRMREQFII
jgi:hypothetical protein